MVFGNAGVRSGSGVGFTRDPATGDARLYFDFCFNGQGEDVVSGRDTASDGARLPTRLPAIQTELQEVRRALEASFRDVQDFEFTVQEGKLYILQTRTAKRTAWAALHIAVDMVREGLITRAEALQHLSGIDLASIERTSFASKPQAPLATAIVASPGVVSGPIALDAPAVSRLASGGQNVILVRPDTVTEDIAAMEQAAGILTQTGSRTSHAAVVARQLQKICLVGCHALTIDIAARTCRIGGQDFAEGDAISLDGNDGSIYAGRLDIVRERPTDALALVEQWSGLASASAR
jgi:pyruvate,orthophosphate dikinase